MGDGIGEALERRQALHKDHPSALDAAVKATIEWLTRNRESFTHNGSVVPRPWWDSRVRETEHPVLLEERRQTLRQRVWGHGLQKLLFSLIDDDALRHEMDVLLSERGKPARTPVVDLVPQIATHPMASVVIRELLKGHVSGPPNDRIGLTFFGELFQYSPETPLQKVRQRWLFNLALFGLVSARYANRTYEIRIGPVGLRFYEHVYFPFIEKEADYINPPIGSG